MASYNIFTIWLGFGFISQGIFIYTPGKNPHDLYVCLGRIPADLVGPYRNCGNFVKEFLKLFYKSYKIYFSLQTFFFQNYNLFLNLNFQIDAKMKVNYSLIAITYMSMLAHIGVGIRFKIYKYYDKKQMNPYQYNAQLCITFEKLNKESFASFTGNTFSVLLFIFASLPPLKMNLMPSRLLNEYPNYLWVYAHHHLILVSVQVFSMISFYWRVPQLRNFLKRELKERFGICPE